MSSMAEGSEGWEREDELDLGQADDLHDLPEQRDHSALALDHAEPPRQESVEAESDTIDHEEDRASENTVEAAGPDLPQTPPARVAPGSVDETASTPDDSPSLHVSHAIAAHPGLNSD